MEIPLLHRQFVGKFHPQKKMYALGTLLVLLVISLYYLLVITYVFPNLLNYVPYAPYVSLCLRTLRALLKRFIYTPRATFSNALHALFVCLKIFLG